MNKVYVIIDDCDEHFDDVAGVFTDKEDALSAYNSIVAQHREETVNQADVSGNVIAWATDENDEIIRLTEHKVIRRLSNMAEHAEKELRLIETDPWFIQGVVDVIDNFAHLGHSGGSASIAIPIIYQLLQFKNLSPLTNDPEEWFQPDMGNGIWQSKRNPAAFSDDGGKTYIFVDEAMNDPSQETVTYESLSKEEYTEKLNKINQEENDNE